MGDVWIGDNGATSHITCSVGLMYDTMPLPPHRSKIILGDGPTKNVQFIWKMDLLVFHSKTDFPAALYDVSFVPDLGSTCCLSTSFKKNMILLRTKQERAC